MSDFVTGVWNKGEAHGYKVVLAEIRRRLTALEKSVSEYDTGQRTVLFALEADIEERLAAVAPTPSPHGRA